MKPIPKRVCLIIKLSVANRHLRTKMKALCNVDNESGGDTRMKIKPIVLAAIDMGISCIARREARIRAKNSNARGARRRAPSRKEATYRLHDGGAMVSSGLRRY